MDTETVVRKYALQNAAFYGGKATIGAVLGKVMAENPDLRSEAKDIAALAKAVVSEVNALSPEQQRKALEELAPELLVKEAKAKDF